MDDYLIEYSDFKDSPINNLLERINTLSGKELKYLKLSNLTYHNCEPIWPGEGVYIFRESKNWIYVGKARSMSFTERVPKHFDLRKYAWFNSMFKLLRDYKQDEIDWDGQKGTEISKHAFDKLNLVLLNIDEHDRIDRMERLLRSCNNPLNRFKTIHLNDPSINLKDY